VKKNKNDLKIYIKVFNFLSKRRQFVILFFFLLSIIGAFTEVASVSLLIPFADLMIDPQKLNEYLLKLNIEIYPDDNLSKFYLLFLTILFITIIFLSSLIKFTLGYLGHLISNNVTHELNLRMFQKVVFSKTITDLKSDENDINSSILKMHSLTVSLQQILSIISNFFILFFIIIFLIIVVENNFIIGLFALVVFYFFVTKITKRILNLNSKILSKSIEIRTNILSNTIGLYKLIKLNSLERFFLKKFVKEDFRIAKAQTINAILITSPGILVTSLIIITFSIFVYILRINDEDLVSKLPLFASIIFSIQKMIPLIQNIYGSIAKLRANYFQSLSVLKLVSNIKPYKKITSPKIKNINNIQYQGIDFYYKKKNILKNLNLNLSKGDRILISGKSGTGKTTLVNILLGILNPKKGEIKVNNKTISQKNFYKFKNLYSYVPQDIFIFSGSFLENIALRSDLKEAEIERIIKVSQYANINKFIQNTKNKYETSISYNARNISGGQKQRLGIARGLYKRSEIYIFDESTNAIDKSTETKIINNIIKNYSNKILIFISHKNLNKKLFNKRYELRNKRLIRI
jgi:ABC-type bacteriocin/lantibiotic exporter with double-glycine peptidase domain